MTVLQRDKFTTIKNQTSLNNILTQFSHGRSKNVLIFLDLATKNLT